MSSHTGSDWSVPLCPTACRPWTDPGHDETSQGHILREAIPKTAPDRISHIKNGSDMFKILDRMFGDLDTSVSIIVNRLLHLKLSKTTDYDKIIELYLAFSKSNQP